MNDVSNNKDSGDSDETSANSPESSDNSQETQSTQNPAIHLGLNFAVGMALFTYIGYKIDLKRGGGAGFTLTGMFMGLIYGAYEVWKLIRVQDVPQAMEDENQSDDPAP